MIAALTFTDRCKMQMIYLLMVQLMLMPPIICCFTEIQTGLTFVMPGVLEKEAIKRVSVLWWK